MMTQKMPHMRVLDMRRKRLVLAHPETVLSVDYLADVQRDLGHYTDAETFAKNPKKKVWYR